MALGPRGQGAKHTSSICVTMNKQENILVVRKPANKLILQVTLIFPISLYTSVTVIFVNITQLSIAIQHEGPQINIPKWAHLSCCCPRQ